MAVDQRRTVPDSAYADQTEPANTERFSHFGANQALPNVSIRLGRRGGFYVCSFDLLDPDPPADRGDPDRVFNVRRRGWPDTSAAGKNDEHPTDGGRHR